MRLSRRLRLGAERIGLGRGPLGPSLESWAGRCSYLRVIRRWPVAPRARVVARESIQVLVDQRGIRIISKRCDRGTEVKVLAAVGAGNERFDAALTEVGVGGYGHHTPALTTHPVVVGEAVVSLDELGHVTIVGHRRRRDCQPARAGFACAPSNTPKRRRWGTAGRRAPP